MLHLVKLVAIVKFCLSLFLINHRWKKIFEIRQKFHCLSINSSINCLPTDLSISTISVELYDFIGSSLRRMPSSSNLEIKYYWCMLGYLVHLSKNGQYLVLLSQQKWTLLSHSYTIFLSLYWNRTAINTWLYPSCV